MKKQICAIGLLALVLVASLLAGCNGGSSTDAFPPFDTTTTTGGQTTTQTQTQTTTQSQTSLNLNQILSSSMSYTSVHYEMVSTVSGQGEVVTQYWMKGQNYRMDVEGVGGVGTMTTWVKMDEQVTYTYTPAMGMVYRMPLDTTSVPDAPTSVLDYSPTILRQEVYDGKNCVVVQYVQGTYSVTSWIWIDTGYPVKMESTAGSVTTTVIWRNFTFNDVSDDVFDLPPGVPIFDMPTA